MIMFAMDGLSPEDFFSAGNQIIYRKMLSIYDTGRPIELVILCSELNIGGVLDKVGGAGYISSMMDGVAIGVEAVVKEYIRHIRIEAERRRIIRICDAAIAKSMARTEAPRDVFEYVLDSMTSAICPPEEGKLKQIREIIAEHPDLLGKMLAQARVDDAVPTGLRDIDELTMGLHSDEFIVLAARPSLGKTALAISISLASARHTSAPVAFFSLEMSRDSILARMICVDALIDNHRARAGFLTREEIRRATSAQAKLASLPVYIDDSSSLSVSQLRARATKLADRKGLSLVVVDYLQLIHAGRKFEHRLEEVTLISRSLKALAKELHVPVLALSQLSRAPEGRVHRRPQLSDLRESGAIEQDADTVMFLWVDKNRGENPPTTLIIGKQRNGPTGEVPLTFLKEYTKFVDCDPRREED